MMSNRWILSWALASLVSLPITGQSIVSVRSGVVHFCEGAVFVDNQPIEQKFGRFYDIKEGSELRTQRGRAEVLLTPGVLLRVGTGSSIRMISNNLSDTRVEFVNGSAILDVAHVAPNTSVTMIYKDYQVRIGTQGHYRFNSDPPDLMVYSGEAEAILNGQPSIVTAGSLLPFAARLVTRPFDHEMGDDLDNWDKTRSALLAESNLNTSGSGDLSGVIDAWQNDPNPFLQPYGTSSYVPMFSDYPLAGTPTFGITSYNTYGYPSYIGGYYLPTNIYSVYAVPQFRYYRSPSLVLGNPGYGGGPGYRGPISSPIRPPGGPIYRPAPPRTVPAPVRPIVRH